MKKKIAFLLIFCMIAVVSVTVVSKAEVFAEIRVESPLITEKTDSSINNDQAAANYILRAFGLKGDPPKMRIAPLTGSDATVYHALAAMVTEVSAGERSSTVCEIPVNSLVSKTSYTAAELNVSALISNGSIAQDAVTAFGVAPVPPQNVVPRGVAGGTGVLPHLPVLLRNRSRNQSRVRRDS